MINLATGPEVPFPVPNGQVDKELRPLVVVQRHGTSSLQFAIPLSLGLSEFAAKLLVDFVRQNDWLAFVVKVVGACSRASVQTLLALRVAGWSCWSGSGLNYWS